MPEKVVVRCSAEASAAIEKIAAAKPKVYAEISVAVAAIRRFGFAGELRVAILNHHLDVYLVQPARPGEQMVIVHDPAKGEEAVLTNVGRFSGATEQQRRQLAMNAAAALGVVVTDILVIRD